MHVHLHVHEVSRSVFAASLIVLFLLLMLLLVCLLSVALVCWVCVLMCALCELCRLYDEHAPHQLAAFVMLVTGNITCTLAPAKAATGNWT
jgi:uncharacterized membrane protein